MTYNQGSRWDKGEFLKLKPVSAEYKKAIADYYQAGLKTGKSSEDLLAELAERYGRSTRTIQRYIRGVIKPQEVTGNKTEVESEITPLPTQVTGEDDREHSLSMYMESVSDNGQEKSGAHSAPPDNDASESPQVKDEHFEQNEKPSVDTNTQPGLTIAEENKHEPLPKDAEPVPTTMQSSDSEPLSKASKESMPLSPEEKSLVCSAPPDNIDIVVLKSWGVPTKKAGDILNRWCELHRKGTHRMCLAYHTLEDNLKNQKMPFRQAELYLNAELYAREFNLNDALCDLERSRKFRIWERPEYRKAYFKDTRDLMKPILEARQKHLKKVENLLKELQDNVLTSLATKKYDNLLKMEENPLFESLQSHCYDVYNFFWDLKRNLETAQYLESGITTPQTDQTQGSSKKKELRMWQKSTTSLVKQLQKTIDYTLKKKSYLKEWCSDCTNNVKTETKSE